MALQDSTILRLIAHESSILEDVVWGPNRVDELPLERDTLTTEDVLEFNSGCANLAANK